MTSSSLFYLSEYLNMTFLQIRLTIEYPQAPLKSYSYKVYQKNNAAQE